MKAFRIDVTATDESAHYAAPNRGKAKYAAARTLVEYRWFHTIGEAFQNLRCVRTPEFDHLAEKETMTCHINTEHRNTLP